MLGQVAAVAKRCSSRTGGAACGGVLRLSVATPRRVHVLPRRTATGFQRYEYGMEWHPTKESLLNAQPGPVLVGSAYEFRPPGADGPRQARKYGAFPDHWAFWDLIDAHNQQGQPQNLHEVLSKDEPRCLYFDLDGDVKYRALHMEIKDWLTHFVRWFFSGDRLGWEPGYPDPVVLTSSDPSKYSCHVVFPQIQFPSYAVQREYLAVLLDALPALEVQLEGGESLPILDIVVDRVPYSQFQLFRGPYACKSSGGIFLPDTQLEPENFFRSDPLACFASRADRDYALELPPVERLLQWNEELRHFHEQQKQRVAAIAYEPGRVSPQDLANLYLPSFQQRGRQTIDFAGLPDLEKYELAMECLHPDRASQWWSWFRISGVTFSMLERYKDNLDARRRIWKAHLAWSSRYPAFCEHENVEAVEKCRGRRVSGLSLLLKLASFDNPNQVRSSVWR